MLFTLFFKQNGALYIVLLW